ncbi:MAG: hypothetical protein KF868_09125 [Acidobacteria bacterium]|nr:hypothetical protein [Acidobacteriota bacterium]MCW5968326.1 hypothetical protein [Blastocatellales bacterium]
MGGSDAKEQAEANGLPVRQVTVGALLFIAGTLLGVFVASLPVRSRAPLGGRLPSDFLSLFGIGSLTLYACLLSSPLYVWLARRFPVYQERWRRNLAIHFLVTSALVPFFILQPLVENALQHGIARRAGRGCVSISATHRGGELYLNVADDGPGLAPDSGKTDRSFPREGIGLSNTRQRLQQLYGDRQRLTLETPAEGGLRVEMVIPFRTAPVMELQEARV